MVNSSIKQSSDKLFYGKLYTDMVKTGNEIMYVIGTVK